MSFYMNYGTFNEGEQAEAYKKKKAEEKANARMEEHDRIRRREYSTRDDMQYIKHATAKQKELGREPNLEELQKLVDYERKHKSPGSYNSYVDSLPYKGEDDYNSKKDAVNRHNRRHPDRKIGGGMFEQAIFMDE